MIRINNRDSLAVPDILITRGFTETEILKTSFDNGTTAFSFNPRIYGHAQVKDELIKSQRGKCCFCESEIRSISYGDVEHYRPKGGWVQNNEELNIPGYYWLAYDWNNLLLSCQICNQQFKKNYFPLATTHTRAINHNYDINNEDPLFINPINENPENYIEFDKNEPVAIDKNIRGEVTIKKLGLDRDLLNEKRLKALNTITIVYNLAKNIPASNRELKEEFKQYILDIQKDTGEYASMLRCFFRKNPIDF